VHVHYQITHGILFHEHAESYHFDIELASHDYFSLIFELVSQALVIYVLLSFSAIMFASVRLCAVEAASAIPICCTPIQDGLSTRFNGYPFLVVLG
jgi:hypothetical protein